MRLSSEVKMKKGLDYTGVSVVFFCHDGKGNVLMNKRSQNCRDERGCWDNGGGSLEFGENAVDGIRREVMEEYCVEVLECEFLGYRDVHRVVDGRKSHWVGLDFKVRIATENVKIGDPHKMDDIGWFRLDALPSPLHSQLPKFLEIYKEK